MPAEQRGRRWENSNWSHLGFKRMATVIACDKTMVGRITEPDFTALASRHPVLWRNVAAELVRRLIGETTQ